MEKRMISFALALLLCVALALPASAASTGYSDVPDGHWSADSVRRATELGLFQGIGGGRFGLGQPMTRAAFATALVRLFGWESVTPEQDTYTDVGPEHWFYSAVETASANGAIPSTGSTFRPTENITREEMAVMLIRGLGYTSLAGAVSSYSSPFTDVFTNKGFITVAYDLGIVGGIGDGRFAPDSTATREQAAVVLVRVYDRLHATSALMSSTDGYTRVSVDTPEADASQELPTTPLEPMAELYGALREMKNSGGDMKKVVLCLTAGGVRTVVSGKRIVAADTLTADDVAEILAQDGTRTYYSTRYESAYCIYQPNAYQTATVWYQSQESLAAKLRLARLFGVTRYIIE